MIGLTLTVLPDEAGTVVTSASDIESQVKTATNATGSAPIYACRAWVNFNGLYMTTRGSGNISSVTDNATNDFTLNFSTAMPDANYAIIGSVGTNGNGNPPFTFNTNRVQTSGNHVNSTASAVRITVDPNAYGDSQFVSVAIFR